MGQYQQWLQLREKEQQLRTQLEKLEIELTELQTRANLLQEPGSYEQNPLLHLLALAARLNSMSAPPVQAEQALAAGATPFSSSPSAAQVAANQENDTTGTAGEMPAIFPWNGMLDLHLPAGRDRAVPPTPLSRPEIELLPEDMASFFDEHTQTSPQLQLPWWMRRPVSTSTSGNTPVNQRTTPVDQESMRNNREIERWLERWGRQPSNSEQEGDRHHE